MKKVIRGVYVNCVNIEDQSKIKMSELFTVFLCSVFSFAALIVMFAMFG